MPRWMGILFGLVGFPLVHGVVPWGLSLVARRYGWRSYGWSQHRSRPGGWNLLGLILVAAGSAYAVWGMVLHFAQGWQWDRAQSYLLQRGPYRFSRNPMYLGELALWLGWAIFYGSASVLLGFVAFWVALSRIMVP